MGEIYCPDLTIKWEKKITFFNSWSIVIAFSFIYYSAFFFFFFFFFFSLFRSTTLRGKNEDFLFAFGRRLHAIYSYIYFFFFFASPSSFFLLALFFFFFFFFFFFGFTPRRDARHIQVGLKQVYTSEYVINEASLGKVLPACRG